MRIRLLRDTDIENILALWNRHAGFDQLTPELLEEKIWDDADYLNDLALVVEHRGQVIAFAFAVIRPLQNSPVGYIKMLVVDRRFQCRGIGRRLLETLEKRLLERQVHSVRIAESAPNYLTPGLDPRYTRAMVLFEKNGYKRFKETWNLEADLARQDFTTTEAEKALAGKGIKVRRGCSDDSASLAALLQKTGWTAWAGAIKNAFASEPVNLHLAIKKQNIIAFAAHNTNNYNTGWFGPVATLDECRGLNLCSVLLHRCLRDIKDNGHRFAIIPWANPVSFYLHHCGAEVSRVFYRYEKLLAK